jgi:hypothetical protein
MCAAEMRAAAVWTHVHSKAHDASPGWHCVPHSKLSTLPQSARTAHGAAHSRTATASLGRSTTIPRTALTGCKRRPGRWHAAACTSVGSTSSRLGDPPQAATRACSAVRAAPLAALNATARCSVKRPGARQLVAWLRGTSSWRRPQTQGQPATEIGGMQVE